jgi:hypothetical protein
MKTGITKSKNSKGRLTYTGTVRCNYQCTFFGIDLFFAFDLFFGIDLSEVSKATIAAHHSPRQPPIGKRIMLCCAVVSDCHTERGTVFTSRL